MDFLTSILSFGKNTYAKVGTLLVVAAGIIAGIDNNKTGVDDLAASIIVSAGQGFQAYSASDYNQVGAALDAVETGVQKLRAELQEAGKLAKQPKPFNIANHLG